MDAIDPTGATGATGKRREYFVLAYDAATMEVRSFTGHGHDFVGAVLAFTALVDRYRDQPGVAVRVYQAGSFDELPDRYPDPFRALRFPGRS